MRLYKETPAEPPPSPSPSKPIKGAKDQAGAKGKGPKGRAKKAKKQGGLGGSSVGPPAEPSWELLASSTEELLAVGEHLTGQKVNGEADIGYQVTLQAGTHPVLAAIGSLKGLVGTRSARKRSCYMCTLPFASADSIWTRRKIPCCTARLSRDLSQV